MIPNGSSGQVSHSRLQPHGSVQLASSQQKPPRMGTACIAGQKVADTLGGRGAHFNELVGQGDIRGWRLWSPLLRPCEAFRTTALMVIPPVPNNRLKWWSVVRHPFDEGAGKVKENEETAVPDQDEFRFLYSATLEKTRASKRKLFVFAQHKLTNQFRQLCEGGERCYALASVSASIQRALPRQGAQTPHATRGVATGALRNNSARYFRAYCAERYKLRDVWPQSFGSCHAAARPHRARPPAQDVLCSVAKQLRSRGDCVFHLDETRGRAWDLNRLSIQQLFRGRLMSNEIAGVCVGLERRRNTSAADADVEKFLRSLTYVCRLQQIPALCVSSGTCPWSSLVAVWLRQIHLAGRRSHVTYIN